MPFYLPYPLPTYLPGPLEEGKAVTFIAPDLIRVSFAENARMDAAYLSATSYVISVRSDTPIPASEVRVLEVLPPPESAELAAVNYAFLRTSTHTLGGYYSVFYFGLTNTGGVPLVASQAAYQARRTKTMSALSSIPNHFDKSTNSLLRNLITAISLEDDTIGGSKREDF